MKTSDFKSRTRNRRLPDPTQLADTMFSVGHDLMMTELDGQTRFRLLGIGVSDLQSAEIADPHNLIEPEATRKADLERAMDKIQNRFGTDAVETGLTYKRVERRRRDSENHDDQEE